VSRSSDAQSFGVDTVGNRTSHARQGASYSLTLDPASNRLASWSGAGQSRSFGYDAVGNMQSEPSRADEFLTQTLKTSLALVDVRVLDHLVVGGSEVVSFAERGLL
jgi:hypothetical protein